MKMAVFWVVAPCSVPEVYQRFRGACCFHYQDALMMETESTSETPVNSIRLHGTTTQKTAIFILAAVRTWNLTTWTWSHTTLSLQSISPDVVNLEISIESQSISMFIYSFRIPSLPQELLLAHITKRSHLTEFCRAE
jgi:hypothetical protein